MFAGGHCRAPHENGSANYRATDFSHDPIFNDDHAANDSTRLDSRDSRNTEREKENEDG